MFARKIKSVFNKLLPEWKVRTSRNQNNINKYFKPGDKVFLKMYQCGKEFWEDGVIKKWIEKMTYMVQGQK